MGLLVIVFQIFTLNGLEKTHYNEEVLIMCKFTSTGLKKGIAMISGKVQIGNLPVQITQNPYKHL